MKLDHFQKIEIAKKAIAKVSKSGVKLPEGEYSFKIKLSLNGRIKKNPPEEKLPTISIPWQQVAFYLLKRAGVTRDSAINTIVAIAKGETQLDVDYFKKVEEEVKSRLANEAGFVKVEGKTLLKEISADIDLFEVEEVEE